MLVQNKRALQYSLDCPVIFSNKYILSFLETHFEFLVLHQVTLIFIQERRFRLTLQFLKKYKVPFHIDFFTSAIDSNAYDVAFYLLNVFEDEIYQN